jgi:mycoredoxin
MAAPGLLRQPRRPAASTTTIPLTVYGRRWCGISQMIRRYLDRMGVPYQYVDLDEHPEIESQLSWMTGGRVRSPTVRVGDHLLVQPSTQELARALSRHGHSARAAR